VGGFPLAECARIMLGAVRGWAPAAKSLRVVRFVLFGRAAYSAFEQAARDAIDGSHT
jgi:O-acetyl-ADP-ribose deacetylase (regulator of RNase III)